MPGMTRKMYGLGCPGTVAVLQRAVGPVADGKVHLAITILKATHGEQSWTALEREIFRGCQQQYTRVRGYSIGALL